ncbi:glycosyltransferase family protein [Oceanobacter kriegii]|uniref:hypothetical protein n=1 Tax=Oceanobacter kriegii TaxID=64972 RepID=UPI00055A40FD|nr:hypothetical protein [Oceanobacter kriegii]
MRNKKVLAIASQGGHLVQLLRIKPLFEEYDVTYSSNINSYKGIEMEKVVDANMSNKFKLFLQFFQVAWLMLRLRPDVVVTTGASVGFFAILVGKYLGAKTIWIDSIANSEELSLSGKKARAIASHTYSQWESVAQAENVDYIGNVL